MLRVEKQFKLMYLVRNVVIQVETGCAEMEIFKITLCGTPVTAHQPHHRHPHQVIARAIVIVQQTATVQVD